MCRVFVKWMWNSWAGRARRRPILWAKRARIIGSHSPRYIIASWKFRARQPIAEIYFPWDVWRPEGQSQRACKARSPTARSTSRALTPIPSSRSSTSPTSFSCPDAPPLITLAISPLPHGISPAVSTNARAARAGSQSTCPPYWLPVCSCFLGSTCCAFTCLLV
jgi:hypothetical protein